MRAYLKAKAMKLFYMFPVHYGLFDSYAVIVTLIVTSHKGYRYKDHTSDL